MNKFFKNTTAILLAGIMGAASLGTVASAYDGISTESFAVEYLAGVSKPTYSVKGAKGYRYIKLSCATSKATIYYTTDGTTPSKTNGKKYSGGLIKIKKSTKFKAIAYKGTTKSSVMTKTFYVTTKPGDVTGDGVINSTDYTRLKSYLNGKTSYICKDNADTSGNGAVSSKDLTLLQQYLNEEISTFPASKTSVTAPSMTLYKAFGGKEFKLTAPKGTIYYTTDGSTPTTKSNKYSGSRVSVTKDTTVKYVAYYNKTYSSVKTKVIEVDPCSTVISKTDTSREYEDSVTVDLSCSTSGAVIYYTTDGTDPRTSYSCRVYTGSGIKLTESTTLKVYARCKGYADSSVTSYSYKVKSLSFKVTGNVWADSNSDGKKSSGESGLSNIVVALIDSDGYTVSSVVTDSNGNYTLSGGKKGKNYKVAFVYNGQKYHAYDYIVTGGNQAVEGTGISNLVISNSGAVSGSKAVSTSNSYAKAITDKAYNTMAYTSATYSNDAQNVNLALKTDNYGSMKLSFASIDNNTVASAGGSVTYNLTLANTGSKAINNATVRVYINNNAVLSGIYASGGTSSVTATNASTTGNYCYYDINFSNISGNSSVTYLVKTVIKDNITTETSIKHCAQVMSYSYAGGCYDKNITPGAMTIGTASQNSEAVTTAIKVGTPAVKETLDILGSTSVTIESKGNISIQALVGGATKYDNSIVTVKSSNINVAKAYVGAVNKISAGANVSIDIYAEELTEDTPVTVTIALASDPSKTATISIIVKKKPDQTTTTPTEDPNPPASSSSSDNTTTPPTQS